MDPGGGLGFASRRPGLERGRRKCLLFDLIFKEPMTGSTSSPPTVIPRHAGYPVRRGFTALLLASLEYWIARFRGR
jgi:hypothetical protein